ncbi:MAG: hypothetical protein NT069_20495 [Planctomycetota bacterium]|nr:hypothetical protein [Planctomycetota bacterium]
MTEITMRELYDLYVDTLERCSSIVRSLPDEELLCNLFEEFDVQARSYLHEVSLTKLHDAGVIDDAMVERSKEIRRRWIALECQKWTTEQIRCDSEWDALFTLCDSLRLMATKRNPNGA